MNYHLDLAAVRSLPRQCTDKTGATIELKLLDAGSHAQLLQMYLAYQPRNSFQGLPPLKDQVCTAWVQQMIDTGLNIVAAGPQDPQGSILGHTALFPIDGRRCEMLVVVYPTHQNRGIGTELVRSSVHLACELGFANVWLPVDATNVRARHVYKKCGFEYASTTQTREVDMKCDLTSRQKYIEQQISEMGANRVKRPLGISFRALYAASRTMAAP
jgi:RimJ/RimL family protein N-acetyltransferase